MHLSRSYLLFHFEQPSILGIILYLINQVFQNFHYLMLKELKRQGLVVRKDRQSLYFLPYYEKHCSGKSTKTKRNVARIQQPEDEDCFQDSDFDTFFEYYHYNLELPKSERMKAWKEWQKLNEEEKEEAMRTVSEYNRSLRKKEHAKLACNYLKDKTYKIKE